MFFAIVKCLFKNVFNGIIHTRWTSQTSIFSVWVIVSSKKQLKCNKLVDEIFYFMWEFLHRNCIRSKVRGYCPMETFTFKLFLYIKIYFNLWKFLKCAKHALMEIVLDSLDRSFQYLRFQRNGGNFTLFVQKSFIQYLSSTRLTVNRPSALPTPESQQSLTVWITLPSLSIVVPASVPLSTQLPSITS